MITVWPSIYEPEKGRPAKLAALIARIRCPKPSPAKNATGRWAPAEFRRNYRSLACFLRCEAIVLDLDNNDEPERLFLMAFAGSTAWAHTTWTAPRWRIVVPLDRAVDASEFPRVQRAVIAHAHRWGIHPELGQSAAHCFALPCVGGQPYAWTQTRGPWLDVEVTLAQYPETVPEPSQAPPSAVARETMAERASKYLATVAPAISGSGGHAVTFRAAQVLVRGFGLDVDTALALMVEEYNPRCLPPWTLTELRHKVRQAYQRGRMPFGRIVQEPGGRFGSSDRSRIQSGRG